MKTAVIYGSKYGATEKYARWIAEELDAELMPAKTAKHLAQYDCIILGGGLYASGILGSKVFTSNYEMIQGKKLVVFTVGLNEVDSPEPFVPIIDQAFSKEMQKHLKLFHFRGAMDLEKLSTVHKLAMKLLIRSVKSGSEQLTESEKGLVSMLGAPVDFIDQASIMPLIQYVKS